MCVFLVVLLRYKEDGESNHEGDPPDARMTAAAAKRGIELVGSSRPLQPEDLDNFDLIIAMVSQRERGRRCSGDDPDSLPTLQFCKLPILE